MENRGCRRQKAEQEQMPKDGGRARKTKGKLGQKQRLGEADVEISLCENAGRVKAEQGWRPKEWRLSTCVGQGGFKGRKAFGGLER